VDASATDAERLIEFAGRICYLSFGERQSPRSNRDYIVNLISQGHDSVLEHASWTFLITNISRALSHQIVRHRIGFSYSQLSQQYVDHSDLQFVVPSGVEENSELRHALDAYLDTAKRLYGELLAQSAPTNDREGLRAKRSLARTVLPNATETKLVVTANARALRHFLKVRGSTEGDLEMRSLCAALLAALKKEAPSVFMDFETFVHSDEGPIVRMTKEACS
jgi:thymidylate synthase (FAD)